MKINLTEFLQKMWENNSQISTLFIQCGDYEIFVDFENCESKFLQLPQCLMLDFADTVTTTTNTSTTNGCLCGRSSFARIINGEDVEQPGDFPWQAVLKTDGR